MKKLFLLTIIAVSFLTAKAQVDPAFTTKFKSYIDAVKDYHLAAEVDKPAKLELILGAATTFFPITEAEFSSKLSAMLNSTTEMAKLGNPVGLVQCLGAAAGQYVSCQNSLATDPDDIPPPSPTCINGLVSAFAGCISQYL